MSNLLSACVAFFINSLIEGVPAGGFLLKRAWRG